MRANRIYRPACFLLTVSLWLAGCSGGGGGSAPASGTGNLPSAPPAIPGLVSAPSAFTAGCAGVNNPGTLYTNAEVEPHIAINPANANNLIASWQQDRWSNGASQGNAIGVSFDAGVTWSSRPLPTSRCGGGNAANGGDYERASDPWVTISPNGTAYQMSLAVSGATLEPGSASAILVFRSTDAGRTWSNATTLLRDTDQFFNDKNTITADPIDSRFVFGVWDRITADNKGPTFFARTVDGGLTWEPARAIYDPGAGNQTIGNTIAVLPDGTVVNFFTQLNSAGAGQAATFRVIRSTDKGLTWSPPITISNFLGIGTRDPETGNPIRDSGFLGQISVGPQGQLYVVWQDARFTNGLRDAIAFARSSDGGITWSPPVRVNADASVQALVPGINARADGTIGVSYFDMRSNTADTSTLLTDYWLATSRDGTTWTDRRIGTSFDLAVAPVARGFFLGDYMGLVSAGNNFYPLYVRTNSGNPSNRTDVFMTPISVTPGTAESSASARTAAVADSSATVSNAFAQRVHENIVRKMERIPGWARMRGLQASSTAP